MTITKELRASLASQVKEAANRRAELKTHGKTLRAIERAVKAFPGGSIRSYVGPTSSVQVHVTLLVQSFTDPKAVKLIERVDNLANFASSHDGYDGRTFTAYVPFYLCLRLELEKPDEAKCRRVIKEVRAGDPQIVYGYECA